MIVRHLIVNADDFGLSHGVNLGIMQAHERGILTSASLMVRWPAAMAAAQYAVGHPEFSLGLHIELAEWIYRDYEWVPKYQVVPVDDKRKVAEEVERQLDAFRRLLGRNPTHLDSHQHVHRQEPVLSIMREVAASLSVPLRSLSPEVQYCGDFYGQTGEGEPYPEGIGVDGLLKVLSNLQPGITELGCHPGDDQHLDSVYRLERMEEVNVLCDARVRAALTALNIQLCSFAEIRNLKVTSSR